MMIQIWAGELPASVVEPPVEYKEKQPRIVLDAVVDAGTCASTLRFQIYITARRGLDPER